MVEDCVDDAVALVIANIGISVKDAIEIATKISDAVFMKIDLNLIVKGIVIFKRTR